LTVSATGRPGTAAVESFVERIQQPSHNVRRQYGRAASCTSTIATSSGTSARPARTDAERVSPPGTHALTSTPELLGEQDRRLLPAPWRDDHDLVNPFAFVEPTQRLCKQRQLAELRERFRRSSPSARPAGGDEHGQTPDAKALCGGWSLLGGGLFAAVVARFVVAVDLRSGLVRTPSSQEIASSSTGLCEAQAPRRRISSP